MLSAGSWLLNGLIGLGIALVFIELWRIRRATERLDEWLGPTGNLHRGTLAALLTDIGRAQGRVMEELAQIRHSLELIEGELRRPAEERRRLEDEIRRQEGWERPGDRLRIVKPRPGETDSEAEARTRAELERKS